MTETYTRSDGGRRVVITGIGAVSPNGIGRETFWGATRAGTSGVSRIAAFDPENQPTRIAGEVAEFPTEAWIDPKDLKHVPRAVGFAMAASHEAFRDSGLDEVVAQLGVLEPQRAQLNAVADGDADPHMQRRWHQHSVPIRTQPLAARKRHRGPTSTNHAAGRGRASQ